jgi:hypothetical protein
MRRIKPPTPKAGFAYSIPFTVHHGYVARPIVVQLAPLPPIVLGRKRPVVRDVGPHLGRKVGR